MWVTARKQGCKKYQQNLQKPEVEINGISFTSWIILPLAYIAVRHFLSLVNELCHCGKWYFDNFLFLFKIYLLNSLYVFILYKNQTAKQHA